MRLKVDHHGQLEACSSSASRQFALNALVHDKLALQCKCFMIVHAADAVGQPSALNFMGVFDGIHGGAKIESKYGIISTRPARAN